MSSELFEKNAYAILGVDQDIPSGQLTKAFAEAKRFKRAKDQEINVANKELMRLDYRLALDAITLAPRVPDAVLDAIVAAAPANAPPPATGDIHALMVVPEVPVSFANFAMPPLEQRHDLAGDVLLQPEIDR